MILFDNVKMHAGQTLDAFLRLHGSDAGGGYFLGGRYSFAEVATSPFIARILVVGPHYRGYDAKAVAAEKGLTRLQAWMEVGSFAAVSSELINLGFKVQGIHPLSKGRSHHESAVKGSMRKPDACAVPGSWCPRTVLHSLRAWHRRSCGWPCRASARASNIYNKHTIEGSAPPGAQAALARPSLQQSTPSNDILIQSHKKFVAA